VSSAQAAADAPPATPLTAALTDLVLADCRAALGPALRRAAGRALFDYAACVHAGRDGVAGLAAAGTAARDAAAAHVLDRDDLHWPSLTHPGGVVWPAVLAAGAADDERRLLAAAAGYEATARLALALGPSHRRYWHATATAGTVGSAVGAAVALGLEAEGVAAAAGHAISVAGGSIQCVFERSRTIVFHRAHAATAGLLAAHAAAAGLGATQAGLEAERGLFAATAPESRPDDVLAPRERVALEELTHRFYASTGFAHAAIEAAHELGPVSPEDVDAIVLALPPATAALAGTLEPVDDEDAWWSVPYAVAVTLLGLELERPPAPDDPAVRKLLAKTSLEPRDGTASTVSVDGRSATRTRHRGHHEQPLSDDDLVAKWRLLNPDEPPPLHLLDPDEPLVLS
jgi:2-methylcitrate dehydratase PrpD